jgi:predicted NUDIX family NTP pyrophosphohydrolase
MVSHSAGIALWRSGSDDSIELLLVHPGGPYWRGKNEHAWSIPKGEFDPELEDAASCALREFAEELGSELPTDASLIELPVIRASGKLIHPFLTEGDFETAALSSNTTEIEWPPRSGQKITIPEVDVAAWIRLEEAVPYLHKGQARLVDHVRTALGTG